jgi:hypothetical protein
MTIKSTFYRSSSFITNVSWDDDTETLLVQFISGTTWLYHDVPQDVYNRLVRSPSVGQFFNKNVRDKYVGQVINKASQQELKNGKKKQEKTL